VNLVCDQNERAASAVDTKLFPYVCYSFAEACNREALMRDGMVVTLRAGWGLSLRGIDILACQSSNFLS
jgi:hypothetical protein